MSVTLLKNGRIIDPASGRDEVGDLWIADGRIADPAKIQNSKAKSDITVDCTGLVIAPGLTFRPAASRGGTAAASIS